MMSVEHRDRLSARLEKPQLGMGLSPGFTSGSQSTPALDLEFLSGRLDSRIAFTRGTLATLVDSSGRITYAPNNLIVASNDFSNNAWSKQANVSVAANVAIAPDGTLTADAIDWGGAANNTGVHNTALTSPSGRNDIKSVYVRADTASGTIGLCDSSFATGETVHVLTTDWQRVSLAEAQPGGGGIWIRRKADSPARIYVCRAQYEIVTYETSPRAYNETTSGAYHSPRFDHDPVTLAAKGLLMEGQRTNLQPQSGQVGNAGGWSANSCTFTANAATAPDGTATATLVTSAVATALTGPSGAATFTNAAHSFSIFVKANGVRYVQLLFAGSASSDHANFDLQSGTLTGGTYSAASILPFGNGWYRISITAITAAGNYAAYVAAVPAGNSARAASFAGDGVAGFHAWGGQIEAGGFPTSYVPTGGSSATRSADLASMTGAAFSNWFTSKEGTFVCEFDVMDTSSGSKAPFSVNDAGGASTSWSKIYVNSSAATFARVRNAGVDQCLMNAGSTLANAITTMTFAYRVNDFAVSKSGLLPATDGLGTLPTVHDRLNIGGDESENLPLYGHIYSFRYYRLRLPNDQLRSLTR